MKRKAEEANGDSSAKKPKQQRPFDFAAHPKRKIALRFFYYGWKYDGLVQQANTDNTVEKHLIDALAKTRLIDVCDDYDLSRCGRTDKGVSAFKQVAALVVRSSTIDETSFWGEETSEDVKNSYKSSSDELPYLKMLNGVLPPSIRITAWAKVGKEFSARHACTMRTYKYSLPRASYDVQKLRSAASLFAGKHDFRNFCQIPYQTEQFMKRAILRDKKRMEKEEGRQIDMNEARVEMSYIREIFSVTVDECRSSLNSSHLDLLELTVIGSGFLWHMIRFIVGVLHEIGLGNEEPELVSSLLDPSITPRRPVYQMAVDSPLCLFDCKFDREGQTVEWIKAVDQVAEKNMIALQKEWAEATTRARLLENMMKELEDESEGKEKGSVKGLLEFVQDRPQSGSYTPFSKRATCDSLEEKAKKLEVKRKEKIDKLRDPSNWGYNNVEGDG